MTQKTDTQSARQVISVLDKVLAKNKNIIKVCDRYAKLTSRIDDPVKRKERTAQLIIMHYSGLCAVGGTASALPGLIPGLGLVYSLIGSGAIDSFVAMKCELEMSLALSHLAGYDIDDQRERKLAFLLACSALEDAYNADNTPTLANVVELAMHEYSSRELSKSLIKAMARVLVLISAKKLTKFFPVIGMGIEASVNQVLSAKLGKECWKAYKLRKDAQDSNINVKVDEDVL